MIKIFYIISIILLFLLITIVKKSKEKIDIITTFFIGSIIIYCFNIIECLTVSIFIKNITLLPLTIINFILVILLIFKIVKDKSIQKFYIRRKDILAIAIIIIIGLAVAISNFGIPFKISFVCTDASNHYEMATDFYQTGNIKLGTISGTYINYGLIFKAFLNINEAFNGYIIFIILEIIKLVFSGVLFYLAIKNFIKTKFSYVISIILSLIYMLSYPLNGTICGFVYFQMAVNIVGAILVVMLNYENIGNKLKNILLFFLTFGLMFTYYILVPPVYITLFLYELKNFKENKKQKILNIVKIFLMPSLTGILYFIVLPKLGIAGSKFDGTDTMKLYGYIFVNYISAFIFFIPFNVYHIAVNVSIKKKKIDFLSILLITTIIYIIFAIFLKEFNVISEYYVMKPYYMLWLVMLTITSVTISNLLKNNIKKMYKILSVSIIFLYIVLALYFTFIEGPIEIKKFEHEKESLESIFYIYRTNLSIISHKGFKLLYSNEELNCIKELSKDYDNNNIYYIEDFTNIKWIQALLLIKDDNILKGYPPLGAEKQDLLIKNILKEDKKTYIICSETAFLKEYYEQFLTKVSKNFKIILKEGKLTIYTNK